MKKSILALTMVATVSVLTACAPATMNTEAAGKKYLEIVCPGNTEMDAFLTAVVGTNLELAHSAAESLKKEYESEIEQFKSVQGSWPTGVEENINVIIAANEAVIEAMNIVIAAQTIEEAGGNLPILDDLPAAAKAIREDLGLPEAGSADSCSIPQ